MKLDARSQEKVRAHWHRWTQRDHPPDFVSIVCIGADRFVVAPAALRTMLASADPTSASELIDTLSVSAAVRRSGEARLAYTDEHTFRPQASERACLIDHRGEGFAALRDAADTAEWQESMSHDDWACCVGIVEEDSLVSVGAYQAWDDTLAHVAVFTARAARSRGLSTEVASATVEQALANGLVPQWRVRIGNDASWRVAEKLGLVDVGRQIFAALAVDR